MAKKSSPETPKANSHWEIKLEMTINNRHVTKDTELKISGERGRFRFMRHVKNGDIEWIDVYGGKKGAEAFRSFREERVRTVHYKNQTGKNLLKQRSSS
jgi:hypothetical protein